MDDNCVLNSFNNHTVHLFNEPWSCSCGHFKKVVFSVACMLFNFRRYQDTISDVSTYLQ